MCLQNSDNTALAQHIERLLECFCSSCISGGYPLRERNELWEIVNNKILLFPSLRDEFFRFREDALMINYLRAFSTSDRESKKANPKINICKFYQKFMDKKMSLKKII